jgi:allophanate hydrolase subunit 1
MARWRQQNDLWILPPAGEPRGLIEFIGGSYLAATPQLSYRRLLEALAHQGWLVHAWNYVPGFDHQSQANEAWRQFRKVRASERAPAGAGQRVLRLGHSLGCKLHLLAPDHGRGSLGLVALCFNNFSAERSIPLLSELGEQLQFRSEFSPSPQATLHQVGATYLPPRNLLVRFDRDKLDQSARLLHVLEGRADDASTLITLAGDHLTPASAGLRRNLLGSWADDPSRHRLINQLAETITTWVSPVKV